MSASFIDEYLANPSLRLYDVLKVLERSKYIQDLILNSNNTDLPVGWFCIYNHDNAVVDPTRMTLYKTDSVTVNAPKNTDHRHITVEFSYVAKADVELGVKWVAITGLTQPITRILPLSDVDDLLTDETVEKLKALIHTKPGKSYNCETLTNQRNEVMAEETETVEQVKNATDPEHYKGLKRLGVQSIVILEDFMDMESTLTPAQKFLCATAMKYLLRCGRKNSLDEDLQKAENYIHRARTGKWIPRELLGEK